MDKNKVIVPIRPYDDTQLRAQAAITKPVALEAPSLLSSPSRVVIQHIFPLQPTFALTIDKAQGQTIKRVIIALSKRKLSITDFQYACLYVALSRVKMRQHIRIILTDEDNKDLQWQSLLYINSLQRDPSIDAFFEGFPTRQQNWKNIVWNKDKAIRKWMTITQAKSKNVRKKANN